MKVLYRIFIVHGLIYAGRMLVKRWRIVRQCLTRKYKKWYSCLWIKKTWKGSWKNRIYRLIKDSKNLLKGIKRLFKNIMRNWLRIWIRSLMSWVVRIKLNVGDMLLIYWISYSLSLKHSLNNIKDCLIYHR
jgi:hypothetical protein